MTELHGLKGKNDRKSFSQNFPTQSGGRPKAAKKTQPHSLQSKWNLVFDKSPEWISFKPKPGSKAYPCYSCKNIFSSKLTFQDHINRRVNIIKFKCSECTNTLTFYNRCSFLLHTRKHYNGTEGQINLANVEIYLLPLEMAGFSRHESIPFLYDEDEEYLPNGQKINSQFYHPEDDEMGKQIVTVKASDLKFKYHDNGMNVDMILKQICSNTPLCEFVEAPQVATSVVTNGNGSIFEDTLIKREVEDGNNSMFTIPIISKIESLNEYSRCPECATIPEISMNYHFLKNNKPLDVSLYCYVCKYMAPSECSLKSHERIHKSEAPFVCPECGKVFKSFEILSKHMDTVCFHMTKQMRFRCPAQKCGKIFVLANTFQGHFANHLKVMKKCSVCQVAFLSQTEFDQHAITHDSCSLLLAYQCGVCKDNPTFSESQYNDHLNWHVKDRELCVYIYTCKECKSSFRSTTTYATHKFRCKQDRVRPQTSQANCHYCGQSIEFREKENHKTCSICKQINHHPFSGGAVHHQAPQMSIDKDSVKKVACVLCKEEMTQDQQEAHGKVCKYINPVVAVMNEPLESDGEDTKKRKKKHSLSLTPVKRQHIEDTQDFDGTYRCNLCDFKDTERNLFHNHVVTHRTVATAYQCMECGECFVVKPSLVKHLLHFHKISDVEAYFEMNDCFDKFAIEELNKYHKLVPGQNKGPVKENQCTVCMEQFENAIDLNKHFRIHGMAFLMKNTK